MLGGKNVDGEKMCVGMMGLGVNLADFMEDGVVGEAEVATKEIDQDTRVGHDQA